MAISDEITRLQAAKADLKTAIENKGVTVPSSAKLGSYSTYVDSIEQGGGGGGSSVSENDVNFIDYDGTIVNSYSAEEFASLSALPNNPNHTSEGLVSQGWNWTLANAKTYVETYGALNIGQMYITDNGATRITIDTTNWEKQWQITLQFNQSKANGVAVDFGDGSSVERASGTSNVKFYHTYANAGIFTISLLPDVGCTITFDGDSTTGCYIIGGNLSDARFMRSSVVSVSIGERLTINNYAFSSCHSLQSVTIPSGVTSIGSSVFSYCYSLQSITIPSGVTSIGSSAFNKCDSLIEIIIESTTPPTLGGSSNSLGSSSDKAVIYVPDKSVDTYKSKYTTYASRIKGISER